jgi:hypothetical protein
MSENFVPEFPEADTDSDAVMAIVRDLADATFDLFGLYGGDRFSGRLRSNERPGLLVMPNGMETPPGLLVMGIPKDGTGEARAIGSITFTRKSFN